MKDSFPARPSVRSLRQLNEATALIVLLRQQQREAVAGLESAIEKVKQDHAPNFLVETAHGSVAISERLQQLEAAVSKYTKKYAPQLFSAGPARTPAASVSAFNYAGGIEFKDGHGRRSAAERYAEAPGFRDAINRLLKRFGLLGRIVLTPDLDWDGLKRSLRDGSLTQTDIDPFGMVWTGGQKAKITTRRNFLK